MIATRLTGGLGNQMFQYAAGRSLAARLGAELVLDDLWIRGKHSGMPGAERRYELACFQLPARLVSVSRVARLPPRTRLQHRLRMVLPSFGRPELRMLVEEDGSEPDGRFFEAGDDTYLDGFWQTEHYFARSADLLRRDFTFASGPTGRNAELADEIRGAVAVSVHVRRGDYVAPGETRDVAGVLDESWYRRAVGLIEERAGEVAVYVFSDEPEWCRHNLRLDQKTVVVSGNTGATSFEDMRLMSLCRHHVIANSTFSWWGAWLDPRPDKIVVAPDPWRMDRRSPNSYPAGAIRLSR